MSLLTPRLAPALVALLLSACVASRADLFRPVDREVDRRLGLDVTWRDATRNGPLSASMAHLLTRPLSLDTAVRLALARNRGLQADFESLGIAGAALADATVLPPTEVDFDYKLGLSGEGGEVELTVVQDVLALIQLGQRRGSASADLAAARARAVAATLALAADTTRAWDELVAAQQLADLEDDARQATAALAELGQRMWAAGNLSALDLNRLQSQAESVALSAARAATDAQVAKAALGALLALPPEQTWSAARQLPDPPAEPPDLTTLAHDAHTRSLELVALDAEAEAAADRLGYAEVRAWLPELGLGAAFSRRDGEGWEAGPAVRLGLPIFDQQQGPRARAAAEVRRARSRAAATASAIDAAVDALRARATAAWAEARLYRDVVLPLQHDIVDGLVRHYNAMDASTVELVQGRRDLVDAGRQAVQATRRYWTTMAEVDALARGVLPDQARHPREMMMESP